MKRPEAIENKGKDEFSRLKLAMSLDYIFGRGTSNNIDYSKLGFQYSRKTGRLRYVVDNLNNEILFSFRANGSIAPTIDGAKHILPSRMPKRYLKRPRYTITVLDGVTEIISQGKTVFCKHVVGCDPSVRPGEDVIVLNEKGELLAVGRTVVSAQVMKQFKRGVAVKVRQGVNKDAGAVV